jgi:hypothetical protein
VGFWTERCLCDAFTTWWSRTVLYFRTWHGHNTGIAKQRQSRLSRTGPGFRPNKVRLPAHSRPESPWDQGALHFLSPPVWPKCFPPQIVPCEFFLPCRTSPVVTQMPGEPFRVSLGTYKALTVIIHLFQEDSGTAFSGGYGAFGTKAVCRSS